MEGLTNEAEEPVICKKLECERVATHGRLCAVHAGVETAPVAPAPPPSSTARPSPNTELILTGDELAILIGLVGKVTVPVAEVGPYQQMIAKMQRMADVA